MAWPDQPGRTSETSLVLYSCPKLSSQGREAMPTVRSREQSRPGPDLGHYTDLIEARLKYRLASTYSPTVAKCQYHIFMANIWRIAESEVKQVSGEIIPTRVVQPVQPTVWPTVLVNTCVAAILGVARLFRFMAHQSKTLLQLRYIQNTTARPAS